MKFLEQQLFGTYQFGAQGLSLYRVLYCMLVVLFMGLPSFAWLGPQLNYVFNPPMFSLAALFQGFPGNWFFVAFTLINLFSFFLMFVGWHTKWASLVFSGTYILLASFGFSFGKIDHGSLMYFTPLFMAFTGWGGHFSVDGYLARRKGIWVPPVPSDSRSFVLALLALCLGFGFFTAGSIKIIGGWGQWQVEGVKYQLFQNYYTSGRTRYLATSFLNINNHVFWKLMDYFTLIFEVGFLPAAINARVFRLFLGTAVVFHLVVLLTFNISFAGNLLAYLPFANWDKLCAQLMPAYTRFKKYFYWTNLLLAASFLVFWLVSLASNKYSLEFHSLLSVLASSLQFSAFNPLIIHSLSVLMLVFLLLHTRMFTPTVRLFHIKSVTK